MQISEELFSALLKYHLVEMDDVLPEIKKGLEEKLEAMVRRDLYTKYKTAPTEEEREKARQEYLEKVTRIFLVAVGIGVVFFVGGLFVLALLWIGRKLRKANNRRK